MVSTQRFSEQVFGFLLRFRVIFNIAIVALTALSIFLAMHLKLKTDFSELLPDKLPSVQALKKASERVGGTGLLMIGIESPDYEANRKFVEEMAKIVAPLVGKDLRYFEYRYEDIQKYISTYGLNYLSLDQLQKLEKHLQSEIDKHKDDAMGLGLLSGDDDPKNVDNTDWKSEMDPSFRSFLSYKDGYLSADDGKVMVLALRPLGSSLGIEKTKVLSQYLQSEINRLNPTSFHPQMKVNLAGSVISAMEEYNAIKADLVDTVLLLIALILLVIVIFFWSFRALVLLVANLLIAVAWTFGITELHIGYLNTQTAFLGSLVVGTGINYGIIFLSRYLENRRTKILEVREAVVNAMATTILPTLVASASTAISFLSLLIAENKGLSQFGFIGALGIILCWLAAFSLLPLWLYQWETLSPAKIKHHPFSRFGSSLAMQLGEGLQIRYKFYAVGILILSIFGAAGFYFLYLDPVEYNFDHLRNKVASVRGTAAVESRINKVFSASTTPSLVLLDNMEQAKEICPVVDQIAASLPPEKNIIKSCVSIYELLPKNFQTDDQGLRHSEMVKIHDLFQDKVLKFSDDWTTFKKFKENMTYDKPELANLPPQLSRRFKELDGRVGLLAFVNPNSERPLNDGKNLLAFTNSLSDIPLPKSHTVVTASGDSFILADLLKGLQHDAPPISLIAFFGAALLAVLLAGGWSAGALMSFCLIVGIWWMLCLQGFMGIKYNFFNFIALPLTFGIGVDYPINVFTRFREESYKNFGKVLSTTGAAVSLCSLTTIIGYYTLLGASNQALVSFAKLAIIGEFTCLLTALFVLPVAISLLTHLKTAFKK